MKSKCHEQRESLTVPVRIELYTKVCTDDTRLLTDGPRWTERRQLTTCVHVMSELIVLDTDILVYCPEEYKLYNGRCFGVLITDLNFTTAEAECKKIPEGHLVAFRSPDELNFINNFPGFDFSSTRIKHFVI